MKKKFMGAAAGLLLMAQATPSMAATSFADQTTVFYGYFLEYLQAQLTYTGSLDTLLKQMGAESQAGWADFQTASANLKIILAKMISAG